MALNPVQDFPDVNVAQTREATEIPSISAPQTLQGYLFKKRKFPSKGWIKRYFLLQDGILRYAVSNGHCVKQKFHGIYDLGRSTIVFYNQAKRFDIDSEHGLCHVKSKGNKEYEQWSLALKKHRMYRQSYVPVHDESLEDLQKRVRSSSVQNSTLANWIINTDYFVKDFKSTLDEAKSQLTAISKSPSFFSSLPLDTIISTPTTTEHKSLKERSLKKASYKYNRTRRSQSPTPVITNREAINSHLLNRNSLPDIEAKLNSSSYDEASLASSYAFSDSTQVGDTAASSTAESVCSKLYELIDMLERQQQELKIALQQESEKYTHQRITITNLRISLNEALTQNTKFQEQLCLIKNIVNVDHDDSPDEKNGHTLPIIEETLEVPDYAFQNESSPSPLELSRQASIVSSSIFFDAYEDSSSIPYYDAEPAQESSDEIDEVGGSDNDVSDPELVDTPNTDSSGKSVEIGMSDTVVEGRGNKVKKRGILPAPRPDIGGLSLWSILRKNIGKDLSRISMPVALNEPLSALQRLSEEMEYSELIEKAFQSDDPIDRLMYIAVFALSPYSTSFYRAGQKVFNPVLGETFELIDEEKNFKFIAEQVSHHPPIAACHAEGPNFMFWEDARLKYKFWGQSMELYPTGTINLLLPNFEEHYTWEKVTTCVHNLLSIQNRWIENYGEMVINCTNTGFSCHVSFLKSGYFSTKKYDIKGDISDSAGEKVRHIFGMLREGIYTGSENGEYSCIWRPNPMPPGFENFYGFSNFAIELNFLPEELRSSLPKCDSRFRPDQHLLEQGQLSEAEEEKKRIEQIQRDARAKREESGVIWTPNFFSKHPNNESWIYKENYFTSRGEEFSNVEIPILW